MNKSPEKFTISPGAKKTCAATKKDLNIQARLTDNLLTGKIIKAKKIS